MNDQKFRELKEFAEKLDQGEIRIIYGHEIIALLMEKDLMTQFGLLLTLLSSKRLRALVLTEAVVLSVHAELLHRLCAAMAVASTSTVASASMEKITSEYLNCLFGFKTDPLFQEYWATIESRLRRSFPDMQIERGLSNNILRFQFVRSLFRSTMIKVKHGALVAIQRYARLGIEGMATSNAEPLSQPYQLAETDVDVGNLTTVVQHSINKGSGSRTPSAKQRVRQDSWVTAILAAFDLSESEMDANGITNPGGVIISVEQNDEADNDGIGGGNINKADDDDDDDDDDDGGCVEADDGNNDDGCQSPVNKSKLGRTKSRLGFSLSVKEKILRRKSFTQSVPAPEIVITDESSSADAPAAGPAVSGGTGTRLGRKKLSRSVSASLHASKPVVEEDGSGDDEWVLVKQPSTILNTVEENDAAAAVSSTKKSSPGLGLTKKFSSSFFRKRTRNRK